MSTKQLFFQNNPACSIVGPKMQILKKTFVVVVVTVVAVDVAVVVVTAVDVVITVVAVVNVVVVRVVMLLS